MRTRILWYPVMLTLVWGVHAASGSVTYDDLIVSVESPVQGESSQGYIEYVVSISNQSLTAEHEVEIYLPFYSYGSGDRIRRIRRRAVVGPQSSVSLSLFQPPLSMWGSDIGVIIDGEVQRDSVSASFPDHCRSYSGLESICILLSRGIRQDDFNQGVEIYREGGLSSSPPSYYGMGRRSQGNSVKSEAPVQAWSTNWLTYSRYQAVAVTAAEMESMPAPVRSALLQYVHCGGNLLVTGPWEPTAEWRGPTSEAGIFEVHHLHYGRYVGCSAADLSAWSEFDWIGLFNSAFRFQDNSQFRNTRIADANARFPVTENLTIPVRGLFLLVCVIAFIIGPVNLLLLRIKKRQIWLLWTVPVFSLAASLSIFVFSLLADGWGAYQRRESVTILDEGLRRATTTAIDAYYCPLTPRGGLHYSAETAVRAWSIDERGGGRSRTVDWTTDQHLESGWIAARVPAHFHLRKSQMRRERLEVHREGEALYVLNGLGTDILRLWCADESGAVYYLEGLAAGARQAARPLEWSAPSAAPWQTDPSGLEVEEILKSPQAYLVRGGYLLEPVRNVFLEETMDSIKERKEKAVILGLRKGTVDAGTGGPS